VQLQRQVESPHVEKTWKDKEGRRWLKVYIGDTDYINDNGWGYSDKEVLDNLNATGIDAPGLLTDYIYHPISGIRAHDNLVVAGASPEEVIRGIQAADRREGKVIWLHRNYYRDKENQKRIYSNCEVVDKDAMAVIDEGSVPKFVSSAAYLYDQPTGKGISKKLHYLHTAIVKKPAYPFAHAIIKASCIGDEGKCNQSLAVAGVITEIPEKQNEEWCNLCTAGKLRDIAKQHSSILTRNMVIASSDLSQEEPNVKDPKEENNKKPAEEEESAKTSKSAVKVKVTETVKDQPSQEEQLKDGSQNQTPTNTDEFFRLQKAENEMLKKRLAELEVKDQQREVEKRRSIIASYINKVYEHEDDKTREEKIGKYLTGSYMKLTDEELVDFLKDKYGEQLLEVAPGKSGKNSKGKAAYAGIDDYITKTADMSGNASGNDKKSYPLLNFSSYIEEAEGVMV
jgi:hypothetical protein